MSDATRNTGTGEGNTIFGFGTVLGPGLGQMVLSEGHVLGYDNARERGYRIRGDRLEFLDEAGRVTSRLQRVDGPRVGYVGKPVDSSALLYLTGLLTVTTDGVRPSQQPKILVNTVPKSGTYWLRKAFLQMGYTATDLHLLGSTSVVDNRGLPDDARIHSHVADRILEMDLGLLPWVLPPGSVTVGHIEHPAVLRRLQEGGMAVINVKRELVDVLVSLFEFKRDVVAPVEGEVWRQVPDPTAQVLGFVATYGGRDVAHARACLAATEQLVDMPVLQYEDLVRGELASEQRRLLVRALGSRRALDELARACLAATEQLVDMPVLQYEDLVRGELAAEQRRLLVRALGSRRALDELARALSVTVGTATSTLSAGHEDPAVRSLMGQLVSAIGV